MCVCEGGAVVHSGMCITHVGPFTKVRGIEGCVYRALYRNIIIMNDIKRHHFEL